MLRIQRASAGSGKTYTLARDFILHLIAYQTEDGEWRLRHHNDIERTLPKILAITFTNKATNEMKERIVNKLSSLALAADRTNLSEQFIDDTDYLKDFASLLHKDYPEIGKSAQVALKAVLNNYSSFHISTIDSFFQEILRTFTYEVNLNDSYQLEIDSDYISASALDSTLNEFERMSESVDRARFWLKILIENEARNSQRWNVFAKSEASRSIYSQLKNALRRLDSEEFMEQREKLGEYFEEENAPEKLQAFYSQLKERGMTERKRAHDEIQYLRRQIEDTITRLALPLEIFDRYFPSHLDKTAKLKLEDKVPFKFVKLLDSKRVTKQGKDVPGSEIIDQLATSLYMKLQAWDKPSNFPDYTAWRVYGELLPYFGLILEVNRKMGEMMAEENLVKLSDTSSLLSKIIGDSDAPFVYERLGGYIDNYLIDEFQDTSRMQWNVLRPLIAEGEANGNDSLIIGDPKQSIYRFRNADHELITKEVPATFPNHRAAGMTKEENTNWRSHFNIVSFNNFFFRSLAETISELSRELGASYDFRDLYGNVVQHPKKQVSTGYVEINFLSKSETEDSGLSVNQDEDDVKDWFDRKVLSSLGPLINSLRERGYRQKDIGILVNTNIKGKQVIGALMDYNVNLPEGEKKIDFLSEESLLLSSSPAVGVLISVLEKIADNYSPLKTPEEERKSLSWHKIKVDYHFYALNIPGLGIAESLISFLNQNPGEVISNIINSIEAPTLEAIVEVCIKRFLTEDMIKGQEIFLAAFQDAVNEYCSYYTNDPVSFLEWWKTKGRKLSVSSPDMAEAVQIMTIHKSKGLEFKCVIIPFATDSFLPVYLKQEWRWVAPVIGWGEGIKPPFLPVTTSSSLTGTPHEGIYREYVDQVMTDKLNMYYVAFTRAKNELYVFCKEPSSRDGAAINSFLHEICRDETGYVIGEKFPPSFIAEEYEKEDKKQKRIETHYASGYFVRDRLPQLHFKAKRTTDFEDL